MDQLMSQQLIAANQRAQQLTAMIQRNDLLSQNPTTIDTCIYVNEFVNLPGKTQEIYLEELNENKNLTRVKIWRVKEACTVGRMARFFMEHGVPRNMISPQIKQYNNLASLPVRNSFPTWFILSKLQNDEARRQLWIRMLQKYTPDKVPAYLLHRRIAERKNKFSYEQQHMLLYQI